MQLEAEEAEARIDNLRRQALSDTTGRTQVQDNTSAGKNYTPVITNISNKMPGIALREIYLISEYKFELLNLS